jgi:hypothetical protein
MITPAKRPRPSLTVSRLSLASSLVQILRGFTFLPEAPVPFIAIHPGLSIRLDRSLSPSTVLFHPHIRASRLLFDGAGFEPSGDRSE